MPVWPESPRVLEINTRVWLSELSRCYGRHLTLGQVPDEALEELREQGWDAVWLMGVWSVGLKPMASARVPARMAEYRQVLPDVSLEDVAGSPYAVSAYEVDKSLGGDGALRTIRERLARRGMRLLLDFVSNHTACDHPLLLTHPAAYMGGTDDDLKREPGAFFRATTGAVVAHGRDPYFPPWTDTAQLHYGRLPARQAMVQTLGRIADRCDGVRCDMAMLLLPDVMESVWGRRLGPGWIRRSFWGEAIAYVRARRSGFLFLAEVYWGLEARLRAEGFDFAYDKTLYDQVCQGDVPAIRRHLGRPLEPQRYDARFLENHDEPRSAVQFGPRARPAAIVTYLSPGLKLFHDGQLDGRRLKLPVQLRRRPAEPQDPETQAFYARLLEILRDAAFGDGSFRLLEPAPGEGGGASHEGLLAFHRRSRITTPADLGWLVVSNLTPQRAIARVALPVTFDAGQTYLFDDRLNGARYDREGGELAQRGLFVALEGYASHVFHIASGPA